MIISFVVAMTKNRVIGVGNHLPWKSLPKDMERFTALTTGHPVIMGSNTYESIPQLRRPLPNRPNIVLTRDTTKLYDGAIVVHSLAEAIRAASLEPGADEICIIGGGRVFQEALPIVNRIYLTVVDTEVEGDALFPELDPIRWQATEEGRFKVDDKHQYSGTFYTYNRTGKLPIVEPLNARTEDYEIELKQILESGQCPFCPGGITNQEKPLYENRSWVIRPNAYPLPNTAWHMLIFPKRHFEQADNISTDEWTDFLDIRRWLQQTYNVTGDALYGRSGELLVSGATVAHFHWHIVVPAGGTVQVSFGHYLK